jgi:Domain of unknown function (DUF397)
MVPGQPAGRCRPIGTSCGRRVTVEETYNGMSASHLRWARWHKGSRSSGQGNCVETAKLPDGGAAVRNSRDPEGPALIFTAAEMEAFLASVKLGDFDDLLHA